MVRTPEHIQNQINKVLKLNDEVETLVEKLIGQHGAQKHFITNEQLTWLSDVMRENHKLTAALINYANKRNGEILA